MINIEVDYTDFWFDKNPHREPLPGQFFVKPEFASGEIIARQGFDESILGQAVNICVTVEDERYILPSIITSICVITEQKTVLTFQQTAATTM